MLRISNAESEPHSAGTDKKVKSSPAKSRDERKGRNVVKNDSAFLKKKKPKNDQLDRYKRVSLVRLTMVHGFLRFSFDLSFVLSSSSHK